MKIKSMLLALLVPLVGLAVDVASPDGDTVLSFDLQDVGDAAGCPIYSIKRNGTTVLTPSRLGFRADGLPLDHGFRLASVKASTHDGTWKPVYGERASIRDHYRQLGLILRSIATPGLAIQYEFRVYNTGVAWQATVTAPDNAAINIAAETTEFRFATDHTCWTTNTAQGLYTKTVISKVGKDAERPLTVRLENSLYAAIGEAALVDAARMKFSSIPNAAGLISTLAGPVNGTTPLTMPWRYVMLADSPGKLLENNDLILNLNAPSAIEDTSWIKPGKVIRETSLTTSGGKSAVDFAVKHNLQYVHFDAGWYGHEYDKESDASTITVDPKRSPGPLDLQAVIRYADEHNIGILLYVNHLALEKQLDEILPLYRKWGIKGVKYGFVNVGSQQWTSWLHDAIRKAADHHLMVDVHDEYRPTGYSRTYPNFMTQEGIRGDEAKPTSEQTLTILFTRMLAGAGDNTICYFDPRVDQLWSHGFQLAKSVCFYSPWQFVYWYDRPQASPQHIDPSVKKPQGNISEEPELAFFDAVPTVWDDTRVIHGAIGEYAVIARRSGTQWFVGCMNNGTARTLDIPFSFLDAQTEYNAALYSDDATLKTRTNVKIEKQAVSAASVLKVALGANQGVAIQIVPAK